MYAGIDVGTSSVKAVLTDDAGAPVHAASAPLTVEHRQPSWSEQDPAAWWSAVRAAMGALDPRARRAVRGVGVTGQMHGAVLLDARHEVIRPAILWNDGRSTDACRELERREPRSRDITGNRAMPGF